jgi:molybdate transport system ATP-binding protein
MAYRNDLIVKAENLVVARAGKSILDNVSFMLAEGDHLAITGAAGSGKTTLGLVLTGRMHYKGNLWIADHFARNRIWIEQQHHFKNLSNTADLYYQQRFNSSDSEDSQTVYEALGGDTEEVNAALHQMEIGHLSKRPLVQLSNGENKKLQLAAAMLSHPSVLVMDQPFVGLDAVTRANLHQLINKLASSGISIIVITSPDEIPECITKVILLDNGKQKVISGREQYLKEFPQTVSVLQPDVEKVKQLTRGIRVSYESMIKMNQVSIVYNKKKILDHINWQVKQGERWLLSGHNGAGKSTLLSLVTADNPQAYANDIYLFDRKRGSGESIWDIKGKLVFCHPSCMFFLTRDAQLLKQ